MIIDKDGRAPTRLSVEEEYPIFFCTSRPKHVDDLINQKDEHDHAKTTATR